MFTITDLDKQNLILLFGPEKTTLGGFFSALSGKIGEDLDVSYMQKKLTFRMPNAGRKVIGHTFLDKGLLETAKYLSSNLEKLKKPIFQKTELQNNEKVLDHVKKDYVDKKNLGDLENLLFEKKNVVQEKRKDFDEILHEKREHKILFDKIESPPLPKNIPSSSPLDPEKGILPDEQFIKKSYRENIEFLKNNKLINVIEKQKNANLQEKKRKKISLKIKFPKFPKFRLFRFIKFISFAVFLIFLPFLLGIFSFLISLFFLKQNFESLKRFDVKSTKFWESVSYKSLAVSSFLNKNFSSYYYFVFQKQNSYENLMSFISLEKNAFLVLKDFRELSENLSYGFSYVIDKHSGGENFGSDNVFSSAQVSSDSMRSNLATLLASLKNKIPNLPWYLRFKSDSYYSFLEQVPEFYKEMSRVNALVSLLPDFLGNNEKAVYVVIFQNNMELRATGGFIGSFGLLTFEKQKLTNFQIYDVYDADGQLNGHVAPPPEILHFLKQPDWFLRDSNVNPDFPESAQKISWFISKEMKQQVDGVFAIDISFVEELLRYIGPIYIPDFKETVTYQNLFEKAERASEMEFFPGSSKKKDYLSILGKNIWAKTLSLKKEDLVKIFPVLQNSISTRHLQFYFQNQNLQNVARLFDASGEMKKANGNFLSIIENNYGANKANYFVKRTIDHKIELTADGYVSHNLKITYQNFSPYAMWPTGDYKPYVKIYVNLDIIFQDFSFANKQAKMSEFLNEFVLENLKPETEQLVLNGIENDKKYYGTFFTVPVGGTQDVVFSWQSLNLNPKLFKNFSYFFQKQAGTIGDDYHLTILFPTDLKVNSNILPKVAEKGRLEYNLKTERDIDLQLKFTGHN